MKLLPGLLLFALTLLPLSAQIAAPDVDAETSEGKILQAAMTETDAAKKQAHYEEFVAKHATHAGAPWVHLQLQEMYLKGGQFDKALASGEQALGKDPSNLVAAYHNLKAAEGKKDAEAVLKWAAATSDNARKIASAPKAADMEEDDHKRAVDYARQVDTYTEYSLFAASLTEPDAAKSVKLIETLEQRNPKSQYLLQALPRLAAAARQSNNLPVAVGIGERAWERGQYDEDLLLAMSDAAMQAKDTDKMMRYTAKLVEVLDTKQKPEGVSDADWAKKQQTMKGLAYWMQGTTLAGQNKHAEADKALRSALPLVQDNPQLAGPALFYLGLSNYQLGKGKSAQRMADAVKFMGQSAAVAGPFQAQARKNLTVMRQETGRTK